MRALTLLFTLISLGSSFVLIPDDLLSLLNAFYSRFPPIRIGMNNTKVGLGFRMGRNVDVQFLVELGPQDLRTTESSKREAPTAPISSSNILIPSSLRNQRQSESSTTKPQVNFINVLRRRRPGKTAPTTTTTTSTELNVEENEIDLEN